MMHLIFVSVLLLSTNSLVFGIQKADKKSVEDVRIVVRQLFDGMRKGDSAMVRPLFHPDAVMGTIGKNKEGIPFYRLERSPEGFVGAVGTPHPEIWDERIGKLDVKIDGDMATVWAPYKFFRGTQFSHCGVNVFVLARLGKGWKIVSITDTRRKDACL